MKKIFLLIAISLLWCSATNLYAYTIDVAKSYLAVQTLNTSSKVIGANGTTPSIMSADISATSQRLSFELVSTGIYRIKNGDGNYLTCTSAGVIAYAASLDATTDAQWTIADVATTGFVSFKSVSLSTSYITSAAVITGPAVFNGTPLTLTSTAPTAAGSATFKLVEATTGTYPVFSNGLADVSFENTNSESAPLGEWINDQSKTIGGSGTSRVRAMNSSTGTNSYMLRFASVANLNGYYKISHKLNGLMAGATYTFGFKYKVDGTNATTLPTSNSQAMLYAATAVNADYTNAIGGSTNYSLTEVPTVFIASQSAKTANVTFVAPATSCYMVFAKLVTTSADFYMYIDDLTLTKVETPIISIAEKTLSFDGAENVKTLTVTGSNLTTDITLTVPTGISLSGANVTGSGTTYTIALANANKINSVTVTYDKLSTVSGNISASNGALATATSAVTATPSFIPTSGVKYYLLQTNLKSGKVVGVVSATQPALNNADLYLSQKFEFVPVSGIANCYYLKNDSSMYLNSVGTTTGLVYESATNSTNSQWLIACTASTLLKFKNVATGAYLTSTDVAAGTVLSASGLSSDVNATYKLIASTDMIQNNMIDGGFENAIVDGAPLGTWINDKSQVLGGGGYSRVRAMYPTTSSNSFTLRFNETNTVGNGYYKISHKLVGLTAGATCTFSFNYKVDNGAGGVVGVNSQARVYAASIPNDSSINAIGGSTNYYLTELPTVGPANQSPYAGSVTFVAPATSCYIVFAKLISQDLPLTYIFMDDMALTINPATVTGIGKANQSNLNVIVRDNTLKVTGVNSYTVYNVQGMKVADIKSNTDAASIHLNTGLYFVKTNTSEVVKLIVR
ncbi:MAG: T9SS type A sorting domain-containing protein [Paludibacter sp.]|nr:T9SS type A sorting domain-containing protein [Paludibacter sp.]